MILKIKTAEFRFVGGFPLSGEIPLDKFRPGKGFSTLRSPPAGRFQRFFAEIGGATGFFGAHAPGNQIKSPSAAPAAKADFAGTFLTSKAGEGDALPGCLQKADFRRPASAFAGRFFRHFRRSLRQAKRPSEFLRKTRANLARHRTSFAGRRLGVRAAGRLCQRCASAPAPPGSGCRTSPHTEPDTPPSGYSS